MGLFSGFIKAVTHPGKSIKHLIHNPSSALVNRHIRNSSAYRNIARPVIKVGTGAAEGFLLGGGPIGAVIGGTTSALGGGLTNNPFRPLPNLVAPALVSGGYGALQGTGLAGQLAGTSGTGIHGLSFLKGLSSIGMPSLGTLGNVASLLQGTGLLSGGGGGGLPGGGMQAPIQTAFGAIPAALIGQGLQQGGGMNQQQQFQQAQGGAGSAGSVVGVNPFASNMQV